MEGEVALHPSLMGAAWMQPFPAVCGDGSRTGSVANISHSGRSQQHIGGTVSTTASQDEGGKQSEEEQRKIGEP